MKSFFTFLVKQDKFAFLLTFMILVLGIAAGLQIQRDMFPQVDFGVLSIETAYPGASPTDVELQITNKVEEAIDDISGIDRYRSRSLEGYSSVSVILDPDYKDQDEIKTKIREAVSQINDLPDTLTQLPVIYSKRADSYPLLEVGLSGPYAYTEIRDYAKNLETQLSAIEGVSRVQMSGYREKLIAIKVNPEKLKTYQLTLQQVVAKIKDKNQRQSTGLLKSFDNEKQLVSQVEFKSVDQIENIILQTSFQGKAVYVKDVATVEDTFEDATMIVRLNANPGIAFMVYRSASSDILRVAEAVKGTLKKFELAQDKPITIEYARDYSFYVKNRLSIVLTNGVIGLLLVLLLISCFLGIRISLWVALGIPVSILGVIFTMFMMGKPLDILSMAGFIIVIGIIVDDAIIVSESIVNERELGLSPVDAAVSGTMKVFQPVIATILTTFVAFLPLMLMPGIVGKFVMVIPFVISLALFFSLAEVLVALPAHLVKGLSTLKRRAANNKSWFFKFKERYRRFILLILRFRYACFILFVCVFAFAIFVAAKRMDFILFPKDAAEQIDINIELPVGSSLAKTAQQVKALEAIIAKLPKDEVKGYLTLAGVSWDSENEVSSQAHHKALLSVYLTSFRSRERMATDILQVLKPQFDALTGFKSIKMNIEGGGPPVGAPVSLEVIGDDDQERAKVCDYIVKKLSAYDNVFDIQRNDDAQKNEMQLQLKSELLARLKLDFAPILYVLRVAYNGATVAEVSKDNETKAYKVILEDRFRYNTDATASLLVANQQGQFIPLSKVIDFVSAEGSENRFHFNGRRSVRIQANIDTKKTTVLDLTKTLQEDIAKLDLTNITVKFGGESEQFSKSFDSLKISFLVALLGMYLILMVLFNSFWQPFIALSAVPFAITGVIIAFYLHDQAFTFLSLLGVVGLTGVVVNDSLVMVHHINYLRAQHSESSLIELVSRGAMDRLRAIVLTTLTTVLGVLPLSYGWGGYDPFIAPMGLALGFGLLFSTPLILILLPCIYLIVQDIKKLFIKA
eukprot:COSAG01_NODE_69_length_28801_cov_10.460038_17_plen_1025_part_00